MCGVKLISALLSLVFFAVAGSNAECPLHVSTPRLVVQFGQSVEVNCSTSLPKHSGMGWEAPENATGIQTLNVVTWIVDELTEWDPRVFCFLNYNSSQCCKILPVIVYKAPDNVSISAMNHSGPLVEDMQYELQCDIQNVAPLQNLTVKWYKGQTPLKSETFNDSSVTPVNVSSTLLITPSRADDGAQYRCEAELELGAEGPQPPPSVTSQPLHITVHYGPEFECPCNVSVIAGRAYNLSCSAVGFPEPTVSWWKDDEELELPVNISLSRAGQYLLTASNGHSEVNHTLDVEVFYPPSKIMELEDMAVTEGSAVVLKCSSFGYPRPKYRWTFSQQSNIHFENIDGISLLYIDSAHRYNSGTYTCLVENRAGKESKSAQVHVQEIPKNVSVSVVRHKGPMDEGGQYQLQCDFQSMGPVKHLTMKWYKGQTPLKSKTFNDSSVAPVNVSSTLLITPSRADDGAQYRCEAELELGAEGPQPPPTVTSQPLHITVHYGPVINTTKLPSVLPVFSGYPEVLTCEADGNPKPNISWVFDNVIIHYSNLTIKEATKENMGLYTCRASNIVNTAFREVKVILKEDYLPLIAGFVAVVVVAISVIFLFIYSIYYKNTKMGRYSLKDAKCKTLNGDIAQNGRHNNLPMKNLPPPYRVNLTE